MVQPYTTPAAVIVKYPYKYVYHMLEEDLTMFNLEEDPMELNEILVKSEVEPKEFYDEYLCERFELRIS